jgi:hypothetical protein
LEPDESLEFVEGVAPPVVVKRAALLGPEQTLGEVDVGRFATIEERQGDLGLDVVGRRLFVHKREAETARRVNLADLAGHVETLAVRRLDLDPVVLPDARTELDTRNGIALRPELPRDLVGTHERLKHPGARCR